MYTFNSNNSLLMKMENQSVTVYTLGSTGITQKMDMSFKSNILLMDIYKNTGACIILTCRTNKNIHNTPYHVSIWNNNKKEFYKEIYKSSDPILNMMFMDAHRIVCVCEDHVDIVSTTTMLAISSRDTYPNPLGLCEISDSNYILTLGQTKGSLCVYDTEKSKTYTINAHKDHIFAIAINSTSDIVASVSENGANIYINSIPTGNCVKQLKRASNMFYSSTTYSLAFNDKTEYLACTSSNGTVHLFKLSSQSLWTSLVTRSNKRFPLGTMETSVCNFDTLGILHVITSCGKYAYVTGDTYDKYRCEQLDMISM